MQQEREPAGGHEGGQSLEEFVDLLQSIVELGKQINDLQRPADLPPPGQLLPPETEPEPQPEVSTCSIPPCIHALFLTSKCMQCVICLHGIIL